MGLGGRHRAPPAVCYIQPVLLASLSSGPCTLRTSFSAKQSIVRHYWTEKCAVRTEWHVQKKQQRPFTWQLLNIPVGFIRVPLVPISYPMPLYLHLCRFVV